LEADIEYLGLRKGLTFGPTIPPGSGNTDLGNLAVNTDYLATLRGRLGVAFDRVLLYATGGLAVSTINFSQNSIINVVGAGFGPAFINNATSKTNVGWALGGGAEYAVTANWIVRAEYLHADLGSVSSTGTFTGGLTAAFCTGVCTLTTKTNLQVDMVRAGLSYKFLIGQNRYHYDWSDTHEIQKPGLAQNRLLLSGNWSTWLRPHRHRHSSLLSLWHSDVGAVPYIMPHAFLRKFNSYLPVDVIPTVYRQPRPSGAGVWETRMCSCPFMGKSHGTSPRVSRFAATS
jgi:hypothetical protein